MYLLWGVAIQYEDIYFITPLICIAQSYICPLIIKYIAWLLDCDFIFKISWNNKIKMSAFVALQLCNSSCYAKKGQVNVRIFMNSTTSMAPVTKYELSNYNQQHTGNIFFSDYIKTNERKSFQLNVYNLYAVKGCTAWRFYFNLKKHKEAKLKGI